MRNFIREEFVFITGVIFLVLLVFVASYEQKGGQKETVRERASLTTATTSSADLAHTTTSSPASIVQDVTTVPTTTTNQNTSPKIHSREQEYDDE